MKQLHTHMYICMYVNMCAYITQITVNKMSKTQWVENNWREMLYVVQEGRAFWQTYLVPTPKKRTGDTWRTLRRHGEAPWSWCGQDSVQGQSTHVGLGILSKSNLMGSYHPVLLTLKFPFFLPDAWVIWWASGHSFEKEQHSIGNVNGRSLCGCCGSEQPRS